MQRITRRDFGKLCSLAVLAGLVRPALSAEVAARKERYILGADVSWLLEDEEQGATYWDRGVRMDLLDILKKYQFNYIRARIFVNPHAPGGYSARRDQAFCDLEHVKKFATRIKAAGLGFLLSIHYSDTWSSPAHQAKPAAWAELPYPKLVQTVHDWTASVLAGLKENQTAPDMVSIGNETSGGMLFPDGQARNFDHFAELTNAGCMAVREMDAKIPVALHHHLGRSNGVVREWVDHFLARKTQFDIIGMSCYNEARRGDWKTNFDDLAVRYPQLQFVAMECSYQKRYLNDLIFNAPNHQGLGSFIWEPTRWREAIFDHDGVNAGNDQNNRPHLPASTLPPLDSQEQPVYRPASPPSGQNEFPANGATTRPAATRPAGGQGFRARYGGRYDSNSYILAYPEMAKAYGVG